ncbi:hypothetical protein ACI2I2_20105 [Scandinavium sp. NPDC088450]|uniref:hypothetical protein n=1 Tax=Scandinavium sp. NPDC088450 TaxID=3364514 RepID=UPI00384FC1E4
MKTRTASAKNTAPVQGMLKQLRVSVSDTHVLAFDNVDTRFNDCVNWRVLENGKRTLFSTRTYEHFAEVKAVMLATIECCQARATPSDVSRLACAQAVIKALDACPSFAALATHPGRIA